MLRVLPYDCNKAARQLMAKASILVSAQLSLLE
jgi:hypothetical protein